MSKLDDIFINYLDDAQLEQELDRLLKRKVKDLMLELMSNTQGENLVAWAENLRQAVRDL